jgi:Ni/Fe-hydrogenase subunit HybB-like protein
VRGAGIITGYAIVLTTHFGLVLMEAGGSLRWLTLPGIPIAALTAVYTAYLFAQARARDLWQNPLLPPHLFIQAVLGGSAALVPIAARVSPEGQPVLLTAVAVASALHLLMAASEATLTHVTAHARLAHHEMTHGRYARFFWSGAALVALGVAAPWVGTSAALAALLGLLAHEHAYVQAGQSVPLA